jgi:uncharacterized protein
MDARKTHASISTNRHIVATAVMAALLYACFSGNIMRFAFVNEYFPYMRSLLATLSDIAFMLIAVSIAAACHPKTLIALSGVLAPIKRPLLWAVIIFLPVLLICLTTAPIAQGFETADVLWKSVAGPMTEEFFYRGLAIGILMWICRWPFIAACLCPAAFFGAVHIWQGSDLGSAAGVIAITAAGGILFGWLFVRWNYNLWPPIFMHVGLNSLWLVFDLGQNAIGGWLGNTMRLAVVLAGIACTFWLAPPKQGDALTP